MMKSSPKNKAIDPADAKNKDAGETVYTFTEHGISVRAASPEDAEAKLHSILAERGK